MDFRLRAPEAADAETIVDTVQGGFEGYREFAPPTWEPPDERQNLEKVRGVLALPGVFCRLAEVDGEPAGHVLTQELGDPVDVHLRYLFVRPPFWGTGIAVALHSAAIEDLGKRTARLYTPEGQARARRFYEREGWSLVAVGDFAHFSMPVAEYRR